MVKSFYERFVYPFYKMDIPFTQKKIPNETVVEMGRRKDPNP